MEEKKKGDKGRSLSLYKRSSFFPSIKGWSPLLHYVRDKEKLILIYSKYSLNKTIICRREREKKRYSPPERTAWVFLDLPRCLMPVWWWAACTGGLGADTHNALTLSQQRCAAGLPSSTLGRQPEAPQCATLSSRQTAETPKPSRSWCKLLQPATPARAFIN